MEEHVALRHEFFTKVRGVTMENDDGSDRQTIISRCRAGERLYLDHQSDNPHDPNAVMVIRGTGEQLGYLSRAVAARLAPVLDAGFRVEARISALTGLQRLGEHRGVNLLIAVTAPVSGVDPEAMP